MLQKRKTVAFIIYITCILSLCACSIGRKEKKDVDDMKEEDKIAEKNDSNNVENAFFEFQQLPDGTYELKGVKSEYKGAKNAEKLPKEIKIPRDYKGKTITSIGSDAFSNCEKIEKVELPDTLTKIDKHAFSLCKSLTSINIPSRVTSIGPSAFSNCEKLSKFTCPSSLQTISITAFLGCSELSEVVLNDGLNKIEISAFAGCVKLKELYIPQSVKFIGAIFFGGDSNATMNCTVKFQSTKKIEDTPGMSLMNKGNSGQILYGQKR